MVHQMCARYNCRPIDYLRGSQEDYLVDAAIFNIGEPALFEREAILAGAKVK